MSFLLNSDSSDDSNDDLVFVGSQGLTRIRREKLKKKEEHQNVISSQTRPRNEVIKGHHSKKILERLEEFSSSLHSESEDDFEISEPRNLRSLSSQKLSLKGEKRNNLPQKKHQTTCLSSVDDSMSSSSAKHCRKERLTCQNSIKQNKSTREAKHQQKVAFSTSGELMSSSDSSDLEETPYSKSRHHGKPCDTNSSASRKLFSLESTNSQSESFDKDRCHKQNKKFVPNIRKPKLSSRVTPQKPKLSKKNESGEFSRWISTQTEKKCDKSAKAVTEGFGSEKNVISETDSESDSESILKSQGATFSSVDNHDRKKKHEKNPMKQVTSQAVLKGQHGQETTKKSQMTISKPTAGNLESVSYDHDSAGRTEKEVQSIINESEADRDLENLFQSQIKSHSVSNCQNKRSDQGKHAEGKFLEITCSKEPTVEKFNYLSSEIIHSQQERPNGQNNLIQKHRLSPELSQGVNKTQGTVKLSLRSNETRRLRDGDKVSSQFEKTESSSVYHSSLRSNHNSKDSEMLQRLKDRKGYISSLLQNAMKLAPREDDTFNYIDEKEPQDKAQAVETTIILDSDNSDYELSDGETQVIPSTQKGHSEDSAATVLFTEDDKTQKEQKSTKQNDSHSGSADRKTQNSLSERWSLGSDSTIEYNISQLSDNNNLQIVPSSSSPMGDCNSSMQGVCLTMLSKKIVSSETCSEVIPFQDKIDCVEKVKGNTSDNFVPSQKDLFQRTPSMPELSCQRMLSHSFLVEGESEGLSQSIPILTPQREPSLSHKATEELMPESVSCSTMLQLTPVKDSSTTEENLSIGNNEKHENVFIKVLATSTPISQVKSLENVASHKEVKTNVNYQKIAHQNSVESPLFSQVSQDITSNSQQIKDDITSILKNLENTEQLLKCDNEELPEAHDSLKETDKDTMEIDLPVNVESKETESDNKDKSKYPFYEAEDDFICVYDSDDEKLFNTQAVFRTSFEMHESSAADETSEEDNRMTQENSLWWDSDESESDCDMSDSGPSSSSALKKGNTDVLMCNRDICGQDLTLNNGDILTETKLNKSRYTLQTRHFDEKFIAAYEKAIQVSCCSAYDGNNQSIFPSSLTQNAGNVHSETLNSSYSSRISGIDTVDASSSDAMSLSDQDTQIDTESDKDGSEDPDPYLVPTQVEIDTDEDKGNTCDFNEEDYLAHSQMDYLFISSDEGGDDNGYNENEIAVTDENDHVKAFDSEDKDYHVKLEIPNVLSNVKSDNMAEILKAEKRTDEDGYSSHQKLSSPYLAQTFESDDSISNLTIETCDDPFSVSTQVGDEPVSSSHSPNSSDQCEQGTERACRLNTISRSTSVTLDKPKSSLTDEKNAYELDTQIDLNEDELNREQISEENIDPYEVDTQISCLDESVVESGEREDDGDDENNHSTQQRLGEAQQHNTFDLATQTAVSKNMHISREEGVNENNIVEYMSATQVDLPTKAQNPFKIPSLFKQSARDKLKLMTEGIFDKMKKCSDKSSRSNKTLDLPVSDHGKCNVRTEEIFTQSPSETDSRNSGNFTKGSDPVDEKEQNLQNDKKDEELEYVTLKQGEPCRDGDDSPENDELDLSMQTMAMESSDEDILEDIGEQKIMNDKNNTPAQLSSNYDNVKSKTIAKLLQSDVIPERTYKPCILVPGISGKKNREVESDVHRKENIVKEIGEKYINVTERDGSNDACAEDLEATLEYNFENYQAIEDQDANNERDNSGKESTVYGTTDLIKCGITGLPSDSSDGGSKRKLDPSSSSNYISKRSKFFTSKNVMKEPEDEKEINEKVNMTRKLKTHKRHQGRPIILIAAHQGNKSKDKGWLSTSDPKASSKAKPQNTIDRKPVVKPSKKTFVKPKKRQQDSAISQNDQIKKAKMLMQQRLKKGAVSGASGISHWRNTSKSDALELKEWDDVEMPSTQEIMESGLPVLNAHMPIDKKKLEKGVPNLSYLRPADMHSKNSSHPQSETDNSHKGEELSSGHNSCKQSELGDGKCVVEGDQNCRDKVQYSKHIEKPTVRNLNPEKEEDSGFEKLSQNFNAYRKREETSFHVKDSVSSTLNESVLNESVFKQHCDTPVVSEVCSGKWANRDKEGLPKTKNSNKKDDGEDDDDSSSAHKDIASSSKGLPVAKGNSTPSVQNTLQTQKSILRKPMGILRDKNLPSTSRQSHAPVKVKIDDSRNDIFYVPARPTPCAPHSLPTFPLQPQPQAYIPDCPSKSLTPFCTEMDFIFKIISWNPGWLLEQDKHERPPPILGEHQTFSQLRTSYDDIETYQKTNFKLLLLEIWAMLHTEWKKNSQGETLLALISKTQRSTEEEQKLGILYFELIVNTNQAKKYLVPNSGDLITLDMKGSFKADPEKKQQFKQFAYVKDVVEVFNHGRNRELFKTVKENFPAVMDSRAKTFIVKICVKYKTFVPSAGLLKIQRVSSLITSLRQFQALVNLPKNPISKDLINPESNGPVFSIPDDEANAGLKTLNTEQAIAVTRISKAVLMQPKEPRICLLQGPPGTGKSHTILALIHQILCKSGFRARICLAAPSNAAVDEIARRIITFSQKKCSANNVREINVLRVGILDRVSEAVKPYHLENKFKERWKQYQLDMSPKLKEELTMVKKKIDDLKASLQHSAVSDAQKVSNRSELRRLHHDLRKLEAEVGNISYNNSDRRRHESIIVDESHVICSTLNSFGSGFIQPLLRYHYGSKMKRQPFNCLIVDEATQAIELETLIPLQYMMLKVVLVGDQQQLPPTVYSKEARDCRFDRSLFERLHFKFSSTPDKNPMMTLKKQYRMHPEILVLPNSYFYKGQLETEESIIKSRVSALSPYLVFDVQDGQEMQDKFGSFCNKMEAAFVSKLCQQVIRKMNVKHSISQRLGIICPYSDQKMKIQDCLRQCGLGEIEVNTVDGFQGQEKDVIIMSCVRAQGNPQTIGFTGDGKRMNVALTRAKLALYIVGHFRTLSISDLWRLLYEDAKKRKLLVSVSCWDGKSREPFQAIDLKQSSLGNSRK